MRTRFDPAVHVKEEQVPLTRGAIEWKLLGLRY